jgi:pimeloyl-ACP methyl ester carboxylesterase
VRAVTKAALAAGTAGAAAMAYAVERSARRRWQVPEQSLAAAGRTMPADVADHFVAVSDGGRIHVVERGSGPAVVLLHGIWLGVGIWAPQLRRLGDDHRVLALSARGHGQSRAGEEGYSFERMATDLIEVLEALGVDDAVVCGHSMGGMVAQLAALDHAAELGRRTRRLVLVSTSPRPFPPSPLSALTLSGFVAALGRAERQATGPVPEPLAVWGARASFGSHPAPADVELTRRMVDGMAPAALAGILPHLFAFDAADRLSSLELPTDVVVGDRDVLTPPRTARALVRRIPDARLHLLAGCGHMAMLEREEEVCRILA